jgi:hypothetical protein
MIYFQTFVIESFMDTILGVNPEGPRFTNQDEAVSFYKKGDYDKKSVGSTEDHQEYKVFAVRDAKLFGLGSDIAIKRNAATKSGDFIIQLDGDGTDRVCVETQNGIEPLTWQDKLTS